MYTEYMFYSIVFKNIQHVHVHVQLHKLINW